MSETILNAELRISTGKADAGRVRRAARIPAVIYGEVEKPLSITVEAHALALLLREKHSLMNVDLKGKTHRVIVREVQYHPVSGNILHIDFLEVKKGNKLTMTVPVNFVGKPEGVKEGGMLDKVKHEVTISVLPKDIPDEITVNIDGLQLGESVRVEDLVAENFEIMDELSAILCRVEIPRGPSDEEEAEEEEEQTEPEVITARDTDESA